MLSKFLGFDLSTQQLKAIVVDDNLEICHHVYVKFDEELGEYRTKGGVYKSDDGSNSVTAPVNMWLKALDLCFEKLKIDGLDFGSVIGISGCAQQHGSVWWRRGSSSLISNLNPDEYLHQALVSAFTLRETPVWMDSSTAEECKFIENYVGGAEKLADITGSRAYERFTGPQIAKIFKKHQDIYSNTERITLISNFLASILCGSYAPFDASDASGMNMMDVRTKRWSSVCIEAVLGGNKEEVDSLLSRLGSNIVDSHEAIGKVSRYFTERYGFPADCSITSFTGDNPASLVGLCLAKDEIIISLGTSDTALFWLEQPQPGLIGHVLRNPIDESQYMGMICFKNGSITRERIRNQCASGDWTKFSSLLESIPRGNFGNIGFYYDFQEIYPQCKGDFRYNVEDRRVKSFSDEIEIRACIEGQVMRLYHHSITLGFKPDSIKKVLVTGGASANRAILQVIADIFKAPVGTIEIPNSASLGAAYSARQKRVHHELDEKVVMPQTTTFYDSLITRYIKLEQQIGSNN